MSITPRVVKPKSAKSKRAILKKEPKLIEDAKEAIFLKGQTASKYAFDAMKDLYKLKSPGGLIMQKKNDILPFENIAPIEKFCKKYNAPLFMFVSNNKKRPHNLIMGRTFEHSLLDMVEFGVENYKGLNEFKIDKISSGLKPMLVFNGDLFENNDLYSKIKNLFIDMFQREIVDNIRLQGLEQVLSFTAVDGKIHLRNYKVLLKKSSTRVPRIELVEIGPSMDLAVRRSKLASDDLFKQSCKKPKEYKIKAKKNISSDNFGTKFGRIHLGVQHIDKIQTRKMKGLKKRKITEESDDKNKKAKLTNNDDKN
ncbi:Similar to Rpf2: Ribosome production factor 2 homolog (Mus musculus) [Cotesia congregata]|uniref:Ribosome production factor 2 homolog n=1 Tax=Cotesia congregata TaxID=51543 RepID=A0A8J2HKV1_COTCN|nr:Similar to Rpf2: Ribosome production factor 2 homolog (Mus musculus) [Cotesia congregata]